jgi:hypothetical protein
MASLRRSLTGDIPRTAISPLVEWRMPHSILMNVGFPAPSSLVHRLQITPTIDDKRSPCYGVCVHSYLQALALSALPEALSKRSGVRCYKILVVNYVVRQHELYETKGMYGDYYD